MLLGVFYRRGRQGKIRIPKGVSGDQKNLPPFSRITRRVILDGSGEGGILYYEGSAVRSEGNDPPPRETGFLNEDPGTVFLKDCLPEIFWLKIHF